MSTRTAPIAVAPLVQGVPMTSAHWDEAIELLMVAEDTWRREMANVIATLNRCITFGEDPAPTRSGIPLVNEALQHGRTLASTGRTLEIREFGGWLSTWADSTVSALSHPA